MLFLCNDRGVCVRLFLSHFDTSIFCFDIDSVTLMDGLEIEEEEELLNLSLSLVSNSYITEGTDSSCARRKNKCNQDDSCSSLGSSDGDHIDHHQGEILRLLHHREQMLSREHTGLSTIPQAVDQESDRNMEPYLIHLLSKTATSINEYKFSLAVVNLVNIYQRVSLVGDSLERVAAYFADGLTAAMLMKEKPPLYDMIMKEPTSSQELLAFTHLYRVSPCYQFSHFTANQAILEAFGKEQGRNHGELHVVDFDLAYGFQWPSLVQSLSEKASRTNINTISLRITGFARCMEELVETEARLISFSKSFDQEHSFRVPRAVERHQSHSQPCEKKRK